MDLIVFSLDPVWSTYNETYVSNVDDDFNVHQARARLPPGNYFGGWPRVAQVKA